MFLLDLEEDSEWIDLELVLNLMSAAKICAAKDEKNPESLPKTDWIKKYLGHWYVSKTDLFFEMLLL